MGILQYNNISGLVLYCGDALFSAQCVGVLKKKRKQNINDVITLSTIITIYSEVSEPQSECHLAQLIVVQCYVIPCQQLVPEVPAAVEILMVMSYSAPGCRSEMMTRFSVQGTVIVPPSCLFLEPMIMLYVTM